MAKMTEAEWRAFLVGKPRTAKLATTRKDGRPHVAPVWIDLDDDGNIRFMTGARTVKGHAIRRDPRVSLCVDDDQPPYSFVIVDGEVVSLIHDPDEMLPWSIRIAGRYLGPDLAEAYGRRNAVPGEMLAVVTPTHVVAQAAITD